MLYKNLPQEELNKVMRIRTCLDYLAAFNFLSVSYTHLMIPLAVTAQTKKKAKKEVAIQLYSVRDILNKVDNKNGKCDPTYTCLLYTSRCV